MATEETLSYESRVRARQGVIAVLAAVLLVGAAVIQAAAGPKPKVAELTVTLISVDKTAAAYVGAAVLQALGMLGIAWTLVFLFRIARARRPEMAPIVRVLIVAAAVVSAISGIASAALLAAKAHDFVSQGAQTWPQANSLVHGASLPVAQTVQYVTSFLLDVGLILVALNAMRVGLLTRFMGYAGVVVGLAGIFLINSAPAALVEIFWLGALSLLFLGRWQGGDPPAWSSGQAEPWPSAASMREQRLAAAGASGGRKGAAARARQPERVGARAGSPPAAARQSGGSQQASSQRQGKRKRKRRR